MLEVGLAHPGSSSDPEITHKYRSVVIDEAAKTHDKRWAAVLTSDTSVRYLTVFATTPDLWDPFYTRVRWLDEHVNHGSFGLVGSNHCRAVVPSRLATYSDCNTYARNQRTRLSVYLLQRRRSWRSFECFSPTLFERHAKNLSMVAPQWYTPKHSGDEFDL